MKVGASCLDWLREPGLCASLPWLLLALYTLVLVYTCYFLSASSCT